MPRPAADALLVAACMVATAIALAFLPGVGLPGGAAALGVVASAGGCAALAGRPRAGGATFCAAVLGAAAVLFASGWLGGAAGSLASGIVAGPVFMLVYRLATRTARGRAISATVLLVACWQAGAVGAQGVGALNPLLFSVTAGACTVGLVVRARTEARDELAAKTQELVAAQQHFNEEAVRAERVRIARELHDIVAHCVSAMVVQANAGAKLASRDPGLAAEAFAHITGSARQASTEIARLVTLLEPRDARSRSIDELVARAQDTGLTVGYRTLGPLGAADPMVVDVAYAVVQEALTNALKHAPGAAIDVRVHSTAGRLRVSVCSGSARTAGLGLSRTGGQHGLTGLRERVAACDGLFTAGPGDHGGWRVAADLPA